MIWHPLHLAILTLDAIALLFSLYAAQANIRVLLNWDDASSDAGQVTLEGAAEGAAFAARWSLRFYLASCLVFIVAVSLVLPSLIKGAMCGTGVMSSMGGMGQRALVLRCVALAALWVWQSLDGINRKIARPPLAKTVARWQLLALPLFALAALYTLRALLQLDPQQPVDCCQAVYDTFRSKREASTLAGLSDGTWLVLTSVGALMLLVLAVWCARTSRRHIARGAAWWLLIVAWVWIPMAGTTLVRVLSAYYYEVLQHHCPWCLFSLQYGGVGYLLYGALLVIGLEGASVLSVGLAARSANSLREVAPRRQRQGAWAIIMAIVLFVVLTAGPALSWRFEHGVWLHG